MYPMIAAAIATKIATCQKNISPIVNPIQKLVHFVQVNTFVKKHRYLLFILNNKFCNGSKLVMNQAMRNDLNTRSRNVVVKIEFILFCLFYLSLFSRS